jgi:NitT/TauT family transport system ATP-binding protein
LGDTTLGDTTAIGFEKVTKHFGADRYLALDQIDLSVGASRFVSLVGPSGCGKSTLLNLAAGLDQPSQGTVSVHGEPLHGRNARATYMFQQDALLPWKTVLENVGLGLTFRGLKTAETQRQAMQWVERVGLKDFAKAYPAQLSGGMRKRAAMAQCWIVDPDILLMDEPFSALDVHLRLRMGNELLDLWTASPKTVLFVTHDLEEAIALADEVVILSAGPASHITGRYEVDLPRPRDLIDIRTDPRFEQLYRHIWSQLRKEVLRSHEK